MEFIVKYNPDEINVPAYPGHISSKEKILMEIKALNEFKGVTVIEASPPNGSTAEKRLKIYQKAINEIDDYFEYRYAYSDPENIRLKVFEIIDGITEKLSRA